MAAGQHISVPDSKPGGKRPLVSMEGWARFEQNARQRRIEKRLEAARTAIRNANFTDARTALAELEELDPGHPEVKAIDRQLDLAEKAARPRRGSGSVAVAAAAFAAVLLGASWIGNRDAVQSHSTVETAPPAHLPEAPLASREIAFDVAMATGGEPPAPLTDPALRSDKVLRSDTALASDTAVLSDPVAATQVEIPVAPPPRPVAAAVLPPAFVPPVDLPPAADLEAPVALPTPAPQRTPPAPAPITAATPTPASGPPVNVVPAVVNETSQVRAVLQKYQAAYERLDAGMVHAVWPGVNEAALARAFEGLESQALTFKACNVQFRGATASAVCTGSARYVPKIGSREPRVEQLAWNFTLRKRADDWEIETARAER